MRVFSSKKRISRFPLAAAPPDVGVFASRYISEKFMMLPTCSAEERPR